MKADISRRDFLSLGASTVVSTAMLSTMGTFQKAFSATSDTSGYKALVCLYLTGGNDGFNTIVPVTPAAYANYTKIRTSLSLSSASLLPLSGAASDGNAYGMHPSCPEMQALFNSGKLAVLGNVGTLVQPTTQAQAASPATLLPPQLFSHMDQTTLWQTAIANSPLRYGWGGRIADLYASQGLAAKVSMNVTCGSSNYFGAGTTTNAYVMGTGTAPVYDDASSTGYRNGLRSQAALALQTQAQSDGNLLINQYTTIQTNAASKVNTVNNAFNSAGDITTIFPAYEQDSDLGAQLHQVARTIKARSQIGDSRQIFFVSMNGFDTHHLQLGTHASLLRILSKNMSTFWTALGELGMQDSVTTFTSSDFGRTLGSNGDGADHAWGNHHFIMGGAVKGGQYYGTMPTVAPNTPDDIAAGRGQLIPTTATDQYAATLANWFGVGASDLPTVFPNLKNFSQPTLKFLGS